MNLKPYLQKLLARCHLSQSESYELFCHFEQAPLEQQAAALSLLSQHNISSLELLWGTTSPH